jgi:phosphate transport system permease protein
MTTLETKVELDPRPVVLEPGQPMELLRRTRARTLDDRLSLFGSGIGSLGLSYILYEQVLPFSGRFGFVLFWYGMFLVLYAVVSFLDNPRVVVIDRLSAAVVQAGAVVVFVVLVSIVVYTFWQGRSAIGHPNMYREDMSGVGPLAGLDRGGFLHAVAGSLIEVGIAVAITLPMGIGTAVFMTEVGGPFARVVRTVVEAMTALPSIVAGLFIYTVLIVDLHFPRTGFAAALALGVMGLPIIARAADVVLRVVPGGLREAGLALGASRWQTVWRVVLPTARPGLATALILGIARMVGETSPVLLTSGASTFFNVNPFKDPMNSLPLFIFQNVRSGQNLLIARAYGAASTLLALVLVLFVIARLLARRRQARA